MSIITCQLFLDASNPIKLQAKDDSTVQGTIANSDFTDVTKMGVVIEGTEYDSDTYATEITWTVGGEVTLKLYDIITTSGVYDVYILVYFSEATKGIRWLDDLRVSAK